MRGGLRDRGWRFKREDFGDGDGDEEGEEGEMVESQAVGGVNGSESESEVEWEEGGWVDG